MDGDGNSPQKEEKCVNNNPVIDWTCCHFHELPPWLQDNEYIIKGYRPPLESAQRCLRSVLRVHTETGNIWTHLVAWVLFLGIGVHWFSTRGWNDNEITLGEKFVLFVYFMGCLACFGMSTAYHTFSCHSEEVGKIFCKLDYMGINIFTLGSFYAWLYYAFYCDAVIRNTYYVVTLSLGLIAIAMSWFERFSRVECRNLRASVFALFGISGIAPVVHFSTTIHNDVMNESVRWMTVMFVMYALGGIVYACRFPEKLCPGKCDIVSHQLFHILIFAGAISQYAAITSILHHRKMYTGCGSLENMPNAEMTRLFSASL